MIRPRGIWLDKDDGPNRAARAIAGNGHLVTMTIRINYSLKDIDSLASWNTIGSLVDKVREELELVISSLASHMEALSDGDMFAEQLVKKDLACGTAFVLSGIDVLDVKSPPSVTPSPAIWRDEHPGREWAQLSAESQIRAQLNERHLKGFGRLWLRSGDDIQIICPCLIRSLFNVTNSKGGIVANIWEDDMSDEQKTRILIRTAEGLKDMMQRGARGDMPELQDVTRIKRAVETSGNMPQGRERALDDRGAAEDQPVVADTAEFLGPGPRAASTWMVCCPKCSAVLTFPSGDACQSCVRCGWTADEGRS